MLRLENIGITFHAGTPDENTALKNINLNKKLRDQFKEQLKVLNMGLEDRLNDNVEQFSGGQRQALTLLMAVMSKPALLLLDEHTAALDPTNAALIMKLTLDDLAQKFKEIKKRDMTNDQMVLQ